jgi:hydroxypyruvate reductase
MSVPDPRRLLRGAFDAAVDAARPLLCVPPALPEPPRGRTVVVGMGKAAAEMAVAVERHWRGELAGLVVTASGHGSACSRIEVREAGHPLPTAAGLAAARDIVGCVEGLARDDLVLCLLSGGGSALAPWPVEGVTLEEKQRITAALLCSGAPIREINCVRRHLSRIKGGRLGVACHPARLVTLAISDVPGDDPLDIASGLTVPDPTTTRDALAIVDRRGIGIDERLRQAWSDGMHESVKPGDPRLAEPDVRIVASAATSLAAAARHLEEQGVRAWVLSDRVEGEAREVGAAHAALVLSVLRDGRPCAAPCVLLSGGETTVTVRGPGRGGRNVEYLLALGLALEADAGVHALAADTDGIDGTAPHAGATWSPDTADRAAGLGLDLRAHLDANDAHGAFERLGDSLATGPTRTNVNDFRAIFVPARAG